jgi:hypothetical protein
VRCTNNLSNGAENCSQDHKVHENLHHIEEEGGDVSQIDFTSLVEVRSNNDDNGHRAIDKQLSNKVEHSIPKGLEIAHLEDLIISMFELVTFVSFSSKCLNCSDVRETFLCNIGYFSFSVLDLLLSFGHCLSIEQGEDDYWGNANYHGEGELPGDDE